MYLGKKSPKFFPEGPFFFVLQLNVYRSALILRNFPALKNSWLRACKCQTQSSIDGIVSGGYHCTRSLISQILPTLYQPYRKGVSKTLTTWRIFPRVGIISEEDSCSGEKIDDYIQLGSKVKRTPYNKNKRNQRNTLQRRTEKA